MSSEPDETFRVFAQTGAEEPEAMGHGDVSTGGRPRDAIDKPSPDEISDSLTGWDELAIASAFGHSIEWMTKNDHELLVMRALAAVMIARDTGSKIAEVSSKVMGMTQAEIEAMFSKPVEEFDPGNPDSEPGKGDSWPGNTPTT